jgi:hypothetical protein
MLRLYFLQKRMSTLAQSCFRYQGHIKELPGVEKRGSSFEGKGEQLYEIIRIGCNSHCLLD